jgi:hypothetical protein
MSVEQQLEEVLHGRQFGISQLGSGFLDRLGEGMWCSRRSTRAVTAPEDRPSWAPSVLTATPSPANRPFG